jgi:predicted MPP superfamily phosphohydrolase
MTQPPPQRDRRSRRRRRLVILSAALAVVLAFVTGSILETRSLRTHQFTVQDTDLPGAFDGLRVAFVSDIHLGPFVSAGRVRRIVDQVDRLQPDLIVLGGDYTYRDAGNIAPVFAELGRLHASLGVYGVLGNHDHWLGAAATRHAMEEAGIQDLDNRGVWLQREGQRLRLCGVDDLWEGRQDLPSALDGATPADFVLLLSHNPDYAEAIGAAPVDLVLSGHTHGGQVTLFGAWAPFLPSDYGQKYRAGLIGDDGALRVLVTTGTGMTNEPLRLFARPEIALLTLRRD